MTPEKAHETARHHLGDRLYSVGRTGPHASEWTVQAVPVTGHMIHATAATPDEAARAAADQLRAAGWTPTHAQHDIAALLSQLDAQQQEIARLRAELDAAQAEAERMGGLYSAEWFRATNTMKALVAEIGGFSGNLPPEDVVKLFARRFREMRAELDAARPGVDWRPDAHGWEVARLGSFRLVLQTGSPHAGWRLFLGDARIEDGPETGDAGKAACYAAWLRACGIAPAPAKKD